MPYNCTRNLKYPWHSLKSPYVSCISLRFMCVKSTGVKKVMRPKLLNISKSSNRVSSELSEIYSNMLLSGIVYNCGSSSSIG